MSQDSDETKAAGNPNAVAFSAVLGSSVNTVVVGSPVKFDKVQINFGGSYDGRSGVFTCPSAGTYQFSLTVLNNKNNQIVVGIVKGDRDGAHVHSHLVAAHCDKGMWQQATVIVNTACDSGQQVWVQVLRGDSPGTLVGLDSSTGSYFSVFSGNKVNQLD